MQEATQNPNLMLTIENGFPTTFYNISGNVHLHEGPTLPPDLPAITPPVNIINTGQDLFVHFVWSESGSLANSFAGWSFECRIFFELMGSGEVGSNPAPVNVAFNTTTNNYSAVITIPDGTLAEGAYKLIATIVLHDPSGNPTPLAAYDEVGVLQVYG